MYSKLSMVGVVLLGTAAVTALPYRGGVVRITSHEAASLVGNACPGCYSVDQPGCDDASDAACSGQSEGAACTFCDGGLATTAVCHSEVGPYDACTVENDPNNPEGCGEEFTGFCNGEIAMAGCEGLQPTGGYCPGPMVTLTPCTP